MQNKGRKLIIFDMDGVLTQHSSSWQYVHNRIGVDNSLNYELFKKGELSYEKFLESDVMLWNKAMGRISMESIIAMLDDIPLRSNLVSGLTRLREHGATLAIVSGGISWLADRINRLFPFDYTYSNSLATDSGGFILPRGETRVDPMKKGENVRQLQRILSMKVNDTISIGDSMQDVQMFRMSSFSVAFNPMEREVSRNSSFSLESNDMSELVSLIENECLESH